MTTAQYDKVREMKWQLERELAKLNAESPHLAACALYDIAGTLAITLQEGGNPNPHIAPLRVFMLKEWS